MDFYSFPSMQWRIYGAETIAKYGQNGVHGKKPGKMLLITQRNCEWLCLENYVLYLHWKPGVQPLLLCTKCKSGTISGFTVISATCWHGLPKQVRPRVPTVVIQKYANVKGAVALAYTASVKHKEGLPGNDVGDSDGVEHQGMQAGIHYGDGWGEILERDIKESSKHMNDLTGETMSIFSEKTLHQT